MDATTLAAADHAARHWTFDAAGRVKLGSEAHKQAFCRMFHETFNPYKPSVIPWPELDAAALRPADLAADLGHRGADRGQGAAAHAVVCRGAA